ncbi:uncharacterized protein L3040_004870 [Drepanopeziza brunnea f. sp. 'multigermtubi']|uniref:uncharacterized protein n=1 Tax=Drepanopeziza brunnea f. sp. 'multigermtubi' TaxID=698441 RepID=UPI00238BB8D9|nr:hypothetical protein L3040_004870 [Drepanopeziza brunnea f. sp. 'multigermtubi']
MTTPRAVWRSVIQYRNFHQSRTLGHEFGWAVPRDVPLETRSAYRGLLRAASYLPDSVARKYAYDRIKARFRAGRDKSNARSRANPDVKGPTRLDRGRLRKAIASKNMLENASNGDLDALQKVLMFVYGRQGERKRELLKTLLHPRDGNTTNISAMQQMVDNGGGSAIEFRPDEKLYKFIRSQQENQPIEAVKQKIRQVNVKIPKESLWGRPVPLRLQKSTLNRWWATTLEKLLPPIPRCEWERLRDLATSVVPLEKPPPRRKAPPGPPELGIDWVLRFKPGDWICVSEKCRHHNPAARTNCRKCHSSPATGETEAPPFFMSGEWGCGCGYQNETSRVSCYVCGAPRHQAVHLWFQSIPGPVAIDRNAILEVEKWERKAKEANMLITSRRAEAPEAEAGEAKMKETWFRSRSMRRLYASVWRFTSTMEYDAETKKMVVDWGGPKAAAYAGEITKPTEEDLELLEGVEEYHQEGVTDKEQNLQEVSRRRRWLDEVRSQNLGNRKPLKIIRASSA